MIKIKAGLTIDFSQFTEKMKDWEKVFIPYMFNVSQRIALEAKAKLEEYTPEPKTSGTTDLSKLWVMNSSRRGAAVRYVIHNTYTKNPNVIVFFEGGTKPHDIRPKEAAALHFFIEGSGIFSKHVHHPGTRAYWMIKKTRDEIEPIMDQYIQGTFAMADKIFWRH